MAELSKLGRYELKRVLGRGAMGVVYEGFDPNLGRQVAIKTILKNAALDEQTTRAYEARFTLEAKAVARLNHPNIVQVHDFGVENEVAYLVMEFVRGRELRAFFEANEAFDQAEVVRIMGELLDALDFAHEANVIHRDVKPANVMLDGQRRVKLADFGVARVQDSARSTAGTMVGTPAFMSPEQIQGHKIDRRTDIFSAGVVLYQLLTGEQPFKGGGAWTVAKKIMQDEPPQPSSLVPGISPAFDAIVDKALAKDPADRFPRARDFAAALQAVLAPPGAATAPALERAAPPRPKAPARASDTELEFWRSIQNSNLPAEFEAYLQQFPEGAYAGLARIKLSTLQGARPAAGDDATIAMPRQEARVLRNGLPRALAALAALAAIGAAIHFVNQPAQPPAAPPEKLSASDIEKIRREAEARIRREYADKSAAEQEAAAKAAADRAVKEKQAALDAAAEKAAAEKAAAEKAAAEKAVKEKAAAEKLAVEKAAAEKALAAKLSAEKAAADKAATERAAAEQLAAEKAAAEKVAAEKAVAEKAAAERAAAEKAAAAAKAAARPGWPSVGDRWVYEARDADRPANRYQIVVDALAVSPTSIRDSITTEGRAPAVVTYSANPRLIGVAPGVYLFAPYLRAFQEVRGGERWSHFESREIGQCSDFLTCVPTARVAGKERIAVRAGTFETWKIVVDLSLRGRTTGGTGELTYWYAEDAKRTVKYRSRIAYQSVSTPWLEPNVDMELVSYAPAGVK